MEETVIRTDGLSRSWGAVNALSDLTLEVERGTIYGFLGPNGAGKTTTIRLLLGLIAPDSGTANVFGLDVSKDSGLIRERCGTLLEHTGLYERLIVRDNLEYEARARGLSPGDRKARIDELLARFELADRAKERAGKLSRGMKQKLATARAILARPALVFLDEPTTGLDVLTAKLLREDIARLSREEGTTVFLTTHNLAEAEELCGAIGVIRSGTLLFSGTPAGLRSLAGSGEIIVETSADGTGAASRDPSVTAGLSARIREAFPSVTDVKIAGGRITISAEPGTRAAPIVAFLVGRGIPVEEVKKGSATLEKAFLDLLTEAPEEER